MAIVTTSGTWSSVGTPLPRMQGLDTEEISWGEPYRRQNPQNRQSSYRFEGVAGARVPLDGTEFKLGTFTHANFSVFTLTSCFQVALKLVLSFSQDGPRQEFSFIFDHNETPNTSGAVPDEVILPDPQSQDIVTLDGTRYVLHLCGFRQDGQLVLKFISAEDRSNSADLFARLVAVPVTADRTAETLAQAVQEVSAAQEARAAAEAAAQAAEEARVAEAARAAAALAKAAREVSAAQTARAAAEAAAQEARTAAIPGRHLLQEKIISNRSCWIWIPIVALIVLLIMNLMIGK